MVNADYFRERADALYSLAKGTTRAAERLELVLKAMEYEARAVDAERGKTVPPYLFQANVPDRENAYNVDPGSQADSAAADRRDRVNRR